jgi:pheromone shutdown-related protein TraB
VEVERITERDVVTELVMELRNFSPSAAEVLLDERDAYIAGRLIELSKKEKGKIVAVVGAGHLEGVQKFLSSPERIPPLTTLTKIEKKRVTFSRVFGIFLILLLLSFFGLLLSSIPFHSFVLAFSCWVVVTGSLAALGAALAGGHPFSVLTAFSLAWFGVLHPLLATGWFSGIVEAWVRTPTQKDFKELSRAQSFRDLYGNRLFRILLVAALTNLGAMMGGWIIGPWAVVRVTDVDIIGTIRGLFP